VLIQADASQLEWRTILELSRDPVGIREVLDKLDTHSINQETFQLPSRLIAKTYLFRTIYNRGKGYAFTVDPNFMHVSTSVAYWDEVGRKFYEKYNGIDKCHLKWGDMVAQGKPIIGPLGRFWPITMGRDKRGDLYIPWTVLTNYPVQGTGADVMMVARVSFWNRLKKKQYFREVKLVSTVHDSIVVDTPEQYARDIANLFYEVFPDVPKNIKAIFDYDWVVPLDCECKYGYNLKDMKKLDKS
jgi:hypothetical protein